MQIENLSKKLNEETVSKTETLKEIELLSNTVQSYKFEIQELQRQLIQQTARETVEEVVELATDKIFSLNTKETQTEFENVEIPNPTKVDDIVKQGVVPTFNWPGADNRVPEARFLDIEQPFVQTQAPVGADASQPSFLSDIESQILSSSDIADAAGNTQALREIEFENVHPCIGEQSQPVVELVQPKQAYLTFQPGTEAFGENDDGWGWGPEESKLEEEHQNLTTSTSQVENLKIQLAQANEKLLVCT